jgi:Rrf2 family cysteine metabolism transcriptional repressor
MRLSTLGRYALRAMVDLAMQESQSPTLRKEIAERQEISSNYLAQLLRKLRRAGLVRSVLGPGGGYVLAKSASEISAGDVLRAVEEPLAPVYCVDAEQEDQCHRADGCPTRVLWTKLGQQIAQTLDSTTLADLCEQPSRVVDESSALDEGQAIQSAGAQVHRDELR